MATNKVTSPAQPTIRAALAAFLDEATQGLSDRTSSKYRTVIDLLEHSIDSYAWNGIEEADEARWRTYQKRAADQRAEFCDFFGPEHIISNLSQFLGYFMVRKVMAGQGTLRAAGTVTKKLTKWLHAKGYASPEDREDDVNDVADRGRGLAKATKFCGLLFDFAENDVREDDEWTEGHFSVSRIEPGRIWAESFESGQAVGPFTLPRALTDHCQVGWSVSGIVARTGQGWKFVEVWNVYP